MPEFAFAIPGDLDLPTGGYGYDRRVITALAGLGWTCRHVRLPADFPDPSPASLVETARALRNIPFGMPVLFDGLAFGAVPLEILDHQRHLYIGLCHHPLAHEAGLSPARAEALRRSERAALSRATAVIVTSPATAKALAGSFGVDPAHIHIACPGTDPADRAPSQGEPPLILAIGAVVPRKNHPLLVRALAANRQLGWRAVIAGSLERDLDETARLRAAILECGLESRIELAGTLSEAALSALYAGADIFALASEYEGYGMVFAEAIARGLPVVATTGGAIADTVPAAAGILVQPGDGRAFAAALGVMITDQSRRQRHADAAWAAAASLPGWHDAAVIIAEVFNKVAR